MQNVQNTLRIQIVERVGLIIRSMGFLLFVNFREIQPNLSWLQICEDIIGTHETNLHRSRSRFRSPLALCSPAVLFHLGHYPCLLRSVSDGATNSLSDPFVCSHRVRAWFSGVDSNPLAVNQLGP